MKVLLLKIANIKNKAKKDKLSKEYHKKVINWLSLKKHGNGRG